MLIMKAFYTTDSNKKKITIMLVYCHLPILYNKVEVSQ